MSSSFASTSTSSILPPVYPAALPLQAGDDCDACLLECSTCSPHPVDPCCPLPLPPQPLSPCSQFFKDCQACATHEGGIGIGEGGAGGGSHLAFCCDDQGCVEPTDEKGKGVDRTGMVWDQQSWIDECAQCVGTDQHSPTVGGGGGFDHSRGQGPMNGLGLVDASCCSSPWGEGAAGDDKMIDSTPLQDCRDAGCFELPSPATLPALGSHSSSQLDDSLSTPATSIGGGGEANNLDLDGLLTGLDDATIQDILNCCCCEEVLHDQPGNFDPSSHTNHQRLPQHIHCDEHHHPAPQQQHHLYPSHPYDFTNSPLSIQGLPPPIAHQLHSKPQHICGWSGCHQTFYTSEQLALHVNTAHLALNPSHPNVSGSPTPSLHSSSNLGDSQMSSDHPQSHVDSQSLASATLNQVPLGQLAQLDPVTALAIFSSVISSRTPYNDPSTPSFPSSLPNELPSAPHRHQHSHTSSSSSSSRSSRRHLHSHPYGVASIRKTSHHTNSTSGSVTPSLEEDRSVSVLSTPFLPSPAPRSRSVSTIASPLPLPPSSMSQTPPSPTLPSHVCRWRSCGLSFSTSSDLMEHLSTEHVGSGKARYTCEWEGCERSTQACEERGDDDKEKDKKSFRQRQKVMRHLQMHTGDRPFTCQVCGKTFSESLTLTQHMRVHTQERPYVCDHPGCDKTFALASALTIHKRTHTGDRPFLCPYPGCTAAFAESSNLSKHIRIHTAERRFVCQVAGCGKAFGRSDQLKRHGKIHERKNQQNTKKGGKKEIVEEV